MTTLTSREAVIDAIAHCHAVDVVRLEAGARQAFLQGLLDGQQLNTLSANGLQWVFNMSDSVVGLLPRAHRGGERYGRMYIGNALERDWYA